jgi:hypothetical protein
VRVLPTRRKIVSSTGVKLSSPVVRFYADGTVIIESPELGAHGMLIRVKDPKALRQIGDVRG